MQANAPDAIVVDEKENVTDVIEAVVTVAQNLQKKHLEKIAK